MKENFQKSLEQVLKWEGGFSDHPSDPGGLTNMGITARTYESWFGNKPTRQDMLDLTEEDVAFIYKKWYWDRVLGDHLPEGVDMAVFDFAVNSGPDRAKKTLQKVLEVKADGLFGPITLTAIKTASPWFIINQLCDERIRFLKSLDTWSVFGKGWKNRIEDLREASLELLNSFKK